MPFCRSGVLLATVLLATGFGCHDPSSQSPDDRTSRTAASASLRLATTTSTRDSGLLDLLLPIFERAANCRVDVIAVGTGAALKLGEAGDADVLLVHARNAEEEFMEAGHGIRHEEFMVNFFTILGPPGDPAQTQGADAVTALQRIADTEQVFVSRGDDSGTHKRELELWSDAGRSPTWHDYLECGQGMGPCLMIAYEKQAYVLTDMGTYLKFKEKIDLVPLTTASQSLRNPYAAIVVNPDKHKQIDVQLANALVDFLISEETQQMIKGYQLANQQLFQPTRLGANQ